MKVISPHLLKEKDTNKQVALEPLFILDYINLKTLNTAKNVIKTCPTGTKQQKSYTVSI